MLGKLLAHPLTRNMDLDSPETTVLRRRIIGEKTILRRIYEEWYAFLAAALPPEPGLIVEFGAGAGFFREFRRDCLATEIFPVPGLDLVCDACRLPFPDGSIQGMVMTDVFHHLPRVDAFLAEMDRCVRPGGGVAMIEPWVTPWSRFVFGRLHHEPFLPEASQWHFATSGPLSSANGALPWIVFSRDRKEFSRLCPDWIIEPPKLMLPLRYILSGGVSMRSLVPEACDGLLRGIEALLAPVMKHVAMFAGIILRRKM